MHRSASTRRQISSGVRPPDEHVGAAVVVGGARRGERRDVEQRTGVEEHRRVADVLHPAEDEILEQQRGVRQHGRLRGAGERRGVHREQAAARVDVALVGWLAGGEDGFVPIGGVGVVTDPASVVGRSVPRLADRVADLLLLPHDDARREVLDDEAQLCRALAPVGRAQHRADPSARQQQLEHAEGVLPEPQHPLAVDDALRDEDAGHAVDARVELGVAQRDVTVDHGDLMRSAAGVLAQQRVVRQDLAAIHVHGSGQAAARSAKTRIA